MRPAALTGRDGDIEAFSIALRRAAARRPARSLILHGLRGVGKTVLLNDLANRARAAHWIVAVVEADHGTGRAPFRRQVAAALDEGMRLQTGKARRSELLKRAGAAIKAFEATAPGGAGLKVELHDKAPNAELSADFTDLIVELTAAAQDIDTGVGVFIDEMQHLSGAELAAISQACHAANQRNLPFVIVGAGLPNLPRVLADAVSYAERLYDYRTVGRLTDTDATSALVIPAGEEGVVWAPDATPVIVAASGGYPYFVQQFGQTTWNLAASSPITAADARAGVQLGREMLDNGFFRSRWDRATAAERDFLRAMAADIDQKSESGEIARRLGKTPSALGPARANLIAKGLIWAPEHGQIAFSVPGMAGFIERETART